MKIKTSLGAVMRSFIVTALLILVSNNAYAVFPSILGTYSGTDSGTNTGGSCTALGPYTDTVTITINSQSGSSFSGGDGFVTMTGTILNAGGDISGSFSSATESGTFTGNISAGGLTVNYSGSDSSNFCSYTGTITATGGTTATFVPNTAPSTALTTQQTLTTSVTTFSTAVTQRLTSLRTKTNTKGAAKLSNGFMIQNGSGMSSGDGLDGPLGIWSSITHSQSEDDFSSTAFDAKRSTLMMGVDMNPSENFVVGLAVGYEDSNIETKFNAGEVDSDGFTFIAYGTYAIDDTFGIDVIGGISQIGADQYRTDPNTAARISSSTDSDRLFFSGNLNASQEYDNWFVTGRAGVLVAEEGQEGFTESNGRVVGSQEFSIGQLRLGAEAAYLTGGDWEPYGSLTLEYDYSRTEILVAAGSPQPDFDRTGATMGLGMRYYAKNGVTSNLEYSRVLGRSNYSEGTLNMTLRAEF